MCLAGPADLSLLHYVSCFPVRSRTTGFVTAIPEPHERVTDQLLTYALAFAQGNHDDYIARNRAIFLELPPDDHGVYVYTYYDYDGYPLYHGYTTDARQRARTHLKNAPWSSWF